MTIKNECPDCVQSSGFVRVAGGAGGQYVPCKTCRGTGVVNWERKSKSGRR
jgi:DnaJ-class molecular chaperone